MSDIKRTVVIAPGKEVSLSPGGLEAIPKGDGSFVAVDPPRSYTLTMAPANRKLNLSLTDNNPAPAGGIKPLPRGPLEMQVFKDCTVTVNLDSAWNWEFDTPAIMISTTNAFNNPPADQRYSNLRTNPNPLPPGSKCTSVSFDAKRLPDGPNGPLTNRDLFNFYLKLTETLPDQSTVTTLMTVDPDIQNPGDDPNGIQLGG